jgi:ABC-type nitrate/sulfonate/bicarbonate transport system ATPase subunit
MSFDSEDFLDFPDEFRNDLFARLEKIIFRGESALLLGPSGMGKSTVLRLLPSKKFSDLEIKFYYLNAENPLEKISPPGKNFP